MPKKLLFGKSINIANSSPSYFQVFIHNPHNRAQEGRLLSSEGDIMLLSINQQVSSVHAGKLNPYIPNDVLAVGSQTNLMVYDVEKNTDLFYKEASFKFEIHLCRYMLTWTHRAFSATNICFLCKE